MDIDRAIEMFDKLVKSTPVDRPEYVSAVECLGSVVHARSQRTGSIEEVRNAVEKLQEAVELTPAGHPNRAGRLNSLSDALKSLFDKTGSMDVLDLAIQMSSEAIQMTSPDDSRQYGLYLHNWSLILGKRFIATGAIEDLESAIEKQEQALDLIKTNQRHRANCLHSLGISLQQRFEATGSMEDLDQAIMRQEQAAGSMPEEDRWHQAMCLSSLGSALGERFERTGSMDDLDSSIERLQHAVDLIPKDHADALSVYLGNLGNQLLRRHGKTLSMEDLSEGTKALERALKVTVGPDRAFLFNSLGIALQWLFLRTNSMEYLDSAIRRQAEAVQLLAPDHSQHAPYLNNLGVAVLKRFQRTKSPTDLGLAIDRFEQGAYADSSAPYARLRCAQFCSDLLIEQKSYNRARELLQGAVQMLPKVSPRQLHGTDAQFHLSSFANITPRAVSLSLETEDAYKCLQLLELGRGILANLKLEVRSDVSKLDNSHPDLARRFKELRDQIDPPATEVGNSIIDTPAAIASSSSDASKSASKRRARIREFDKLLSFIRSQDGLENFLQGPSREELCSIAHNGAIVVFNVSDVGSDAFLITPQDIRSIPLPLLTSDRVEELVERFYEAIDHDLSEYRLATHEMNRVLEELWTCGIKQVLDELGFTERPPDGKAWPRVWWVGSGLLSILPIHAAGYHDSKSSDTALDRVISSYAFTVKSLSYAFERSEKTQAGSSQNAILFAMPTTPDQTPLRFVSEEVKAVKHLLSTACINTTILTNPLKSEALSKLPTHGIVHFACHGYSAPDPSQSCLFLQDEPLTVSDLIALNIDSGKLAYLSACHTSTMRNSALINESISLASAIQLCGYPAVVGSLWQVADYDSVDVAKDFYTSILEGENGLDIRRSAQSLHKAIHQLRARTRILGKHDPLTWAPFIHIGI